MKLVSKKKTNRNTRYDITTKKNHNYFVNGVCVHNSNGGVVLDFNSNESWVQSRERSITPQDDNAGFAMFVQSKKDFFEKFFNIIKDSNIEQLKNSRYIGIYGEWAGKGIQKNVAISEVERFFSVFAIVLYDEDHTRYYLPKEDFVNIMERLADRKDNRIFNVYDFKTFYIGIDFENPHIAQDQINERVDEVENRCPAGEYFGIDGIGEGIVFKCISPGFKGSAYTFKAKGAKHSNSKVRTLAKVDVEKIEQINDLVEKLANNERLEQMCQSVFDTLNGGEIDVKGLDPFIKAVMNDIFKEELDTVAASGFTGKDISGPASKVCRNFIMKKI